jgi:hypothetical protein
MLSRAAPLFLSILLTSTGCRDGLGGAWATYAVRGSVTDSYGQLASGMPVIVTTWAPNQCGTGLANQLASTTTNTQGFYSVHLNPVASTSSLCFRVSAGSRDRDTTVINKPALQAVQIDVVVP